ncbi:hypothetical protein R1sor_001376 [Riccia sorocarpa]|uniref:Endonuclease/exonuclease/phosphatase domain-containing protein n=1 Tax=Riccia sorocarpa TaxID=122646 RepID=A0ABD3GYD1_9MARC
MRVPHQRYSIKGFLKNEKPDFLAIQETHLKADKLKFFVSTLSSEYLVLASSSLGRKRGVAVLYHSRFKLLQSGGDNVGRVVWGKFQCGDQQLSIVSVYAPNDSSERIDFWRDLRTVLPQGTWIAAGDWNSVCSSLDSSSRSNLQSEEEAANFQALCEGLGVSDARERCLKTQGPKFSRAQFRDGKLLWSRLDRIYVPDWRISRVTHHTRYWTSDHIPVTAAIDVNAPVKETRQTFCSAYFKADPYVVEENLNYLKEVWEETQRKFAGGSAMEQFARCWLAIRKELKVLQYQKKQKLLLLPQKERAIKELLTSNSEDLSEEQESELAVLMDEIRELQAWNHHRWRLTCREKFLADGDAATAYFFGKFKKRRARVQIKKIKSDEGVWLENEEQIKRFVFNSFSTLYSPHDFSPREKDSLELEVLLSTNLGELSKEQNAMLEDTPSENEILGALSLLPAGKSPGVDGFSPEILRLLWPFIGSLFCSAVYWITLWPNSGNRGFSCPVLKKVVKGLQADVDSRTLLNASLLPSFRVGRGVRQGCPLSPLLYVIASIPIIQNIKALNQEGRIIPVKLSGGIQVSSVCLADDLAVFMEINATSFRNFLYLLDVIELGMGGRVNLQKSKMLIMGASRRFPTWVQVANMKLAEPHEVTRYLGASLMTFQRALIVRLILKALRTPVESLWAPILSVAAWKDGGFPEGDLKDILFLAARIHLGVTAANAMVKSFMEACTRAGVAAGWGAPAFVKKKFISSSGGSSLGAVGNGAG